MKSIGQFAKENNITVKTLHHYEKMDLIKPLKVDDITGYRYYGDIESQDLKIVLVLKDLGFSLSEIKDVISDKFDNDSFVEFLLFKKSQADRDKHNASSRLLKLSNLLNTLKKENKIVNYKELIMVSEKEFYTGKYGRGKFIEESEKIFYQAKEHKTDLCVIQLDLDMFHKLNQKYGYDVGDIVLDRTTTEIISVLKEYSYNSLLERKGGDEYSIIVETNPFNAAKIATKILNRVLEVNYDDVAEKLKVHITAGIAGLTKDIEMYEQLVQEATLRLYEAKRNKR